MGLCALCQGIDFFNLPSLPSHYETTYNIWDGTNELLAFASLQLRTARKAGEDENAGEFSQPLGLPHHQSIDELRAAADQCSICSLIERSVSRCLAALAEAEKDEQYVYYKDKQRQRTPDFRLWLTSRRDDCDGFMVVTSGDLMEVWLVAAVGFCVKENDPLSSLIPGRLIEKDSGCETTISRALTWVNECNAQHKDTRCDVGDVKLPKRVLDLEYAPAPSRIRLYETNGEVERWTVLSHKWGEHRHFITTSSNIATHKEGIAFEILPKTFQDAIILTRKLGIRYLWIDSICICQDDGPDWERESAKMASIYANAYLTIAATGSLNDKHGFFIPRTPPEYTAFEYSTKDGIRGTLHAFEMPKTASARRNEYCSLDDEPLSKRGWALQERFLASRILHSGSKQMFFECYGHVRAEDGFRCQGRFTSVYEDTHPIQVNPEMSGVSKRSAQVKAYRGPSQWYSLLYSYYPRQLTKSSDKLPALSGIARTIEEETGDKYVAGMWRSQLIEGLIWQAMGTLRGATKSPLEYRAPSWSWASMDGPFGNLGLGEDFLDENARWVDVATVIDCRVELKGENPYGEVKSGWLEIKAPLEPLSASEEKEPDWERVPHKRAMRMKTRVGNPFGSPCMFDTMDQEVASTVSLFALILTWRLTQDDPKNRIYQALLITLVEGSESRYRRVGKILFGYEALGKCDWMDDDTKLATITLI